MSTEENLLSDDPIVAQVVENPQPKPRRTTRKKRATTTKADTQKSGKITLVSLSGRLDGLKATPNIELRSSYDRSGVIRVYTSDGQPTMRRVDSIGDRIGFILNESERAAVPTGIRVDIPGHSTVSIIPDHKFMMMHGVVSMGVDVNQSTGELYVIVANVSKVRTMINDDSLLGKLVIAPGTCQFDVEIKDENS